MAAPREAVPTHPARLLSVALTRLLVGLIDAYRCMLSPWIGQHCRFHPTCSRFAREAILRHGPARGSWLALRRLLKCHPWHEGGLDPVPSAAPHADRDAANPARDST